MVSLRPVFCISSWSTAFECDDHQQPVLDRRVAGECEHSGEFSFVTPGHPDSGDYPGRGHGRRRRRRRHHLRQLSDRLPGGQPRIGRDPARRRLANPSGEFPCGALAGLVAGHGGGVDYHRPHRHGGGLAVQPQHYPRLADWRDCRLHGRRGGVLAAGRQGLERAGQRQPGNRIRQQRPDGGVSHCHPDRHARQRPDRPALEPTDPSGARIRHRRPGRIGRRLADAANGQSHQPGHRPLSDSGDRRRPVSSLP